MPGGALAHSETPCTTTTGFGNKGKIAEEERDELFNRDIPMLPTKTWREKRIAEELSRTADDTISDANSENNRDASNDMDVDQGG